MSSASELKLLLVRLFAVDLSALRDDTPLFQEGLHLDSLDVAQLEAALEHDLGVSFVSMKQRKEALATVGSLEVFVAASKSGKI